MNIKIGNIEHISSEDSFSLTSKDYRLFCVKEGKLSVDIDDKVFKFKEGGIFLVNIDQVIKVAMSNECILVCITLSKNNVTRYSEYSSVSFECNTSLRDGLKYDELRRLINRIERLNDDDSHLVLNSQYLVLLNELLVNYVNSSVPKNNEKKEHLKYFKRNMRIKDFIEENYNHDISLSDLADELKLSLSYTSRFFNEQFGLSFTDYLNGIRLLNASDDLVYTDLTIIKIAMINGFTNVSRFNYVFKDKYGTTPSAYRITQRKEVNHHKDNQFDIDDLNRRHKIKMGKRMSSYVTSDVIQKEDFDIDVLLTKGKQDFGFRLMMNFGEIDGLSESAQLDRNLDQAALYGFKYVRIKLSASKEADENPPYLFKLLESILSRNLIPYLAFYGDKITEQKMRLILSELINRYGVSNVRNWYFEVIVGTKNIQSISKSLSVINDVVDNTNVGIQLNKKTSVDELVILKSELEDRDYGFISIQHFIDSVDENYDPVIFLAKISKSLREVFDNKPVVLSEWGFAKNDNPIHDSLFWGSYMIKFILEVKSLFQMMGYINVNDGMLNNNSGKIFFGGSGLQNGNFIEKPSASAFIFLKKMGDDILYHNDNLIVTKRNEYEYLLIGQNTHKLNDYYQRHRNTISREDMDLIFNLDSTLRANLNLINLPLGDYKIKTYLVDDSGGNVIETWKKLGNISNLRSDEFAYLRANSLPNLSLQMIKNSGIMTIPVTLSRNNFFMTYIYRIF